MNLAWLLIPLVVGLAQPIIWQMNVRFSAHTGAMEAALALHLVGSVVGLGWLMAGLRGTGEGGLGAVPWWAWLAGAIGLTCMAAMNKAIPHVGVAAALAFTVGAQLGASLLFEHFGWMGSEVRPATVQRWAGVAMLTFGAWLVVR